MISTILVATDGSEVARKAVEFAIGLAKQIGAMLKLLSVADKGLFLSPSVPEEVTPTHIQEPTEDFLKQVAEKCLEEGEKLADENGVQSEKVIRVGDPVEEIIKEAEGSKADLVVMGSHGKTALKAAMIGSVTIGVIHKDTRIPVLVVRR